MSLSCKACGLHGWRACEMHERLAVLSYNLKAGAALCRAFELGGGARTVLYALVPGGYSKVDRWRPGCGREAL